MIIFTELVLYPFSCRAMVLGSLQCRGGRPTTLAYGRQGPAALATGAGRIGFFFLLFFFNFVYPIFLF